MKLKVKSLSPVQIFVTPWTVAYQAPPSMGFYGQEYWSGLPFPSPGDLPNSGIEPRSPAFQADALTSEPPGKPHIYLYMSIYISTPIYIGLPWRSHNEESACDARCPNSILDWKDIYIYIHIWIIYMWIIIGRGVYIYL